MIANQTRGGGFRGALEYVFGPGHNDAPDRAVLLGGSMAGWDPRSLAREFGELRSLRPDCMNPVKHLSFRLPDHEHLTVEQWLEVGAAKAAQEGWDTWCLVRHNDEPGDHVHMLASRITQDARVIREDAFDVKGTEQLCREFELKFGLQQLQSPERSLTGKKIRTERDRVKAPTHAERDMMARTHERSDKVDYQVEILAALETRPTTWEEFREALEARGIGLRTTVKKGEVTGVSFDASGATPMKGSALGMDFGGAALNSQISENQEEAHAAARTITGARVPRTAPTLTDDGPSIRRNRVGVEARRAELERASRTPEPGGSAGVGPAGDLAGPDGHSGVDLGTEHQQRDGHREAEGGEGPLGAAGLAASWRPLNPELDPCGGDRQGRSAEGYGGPADGTGGTDDRAAAGPGLGDGESHGYRTDGGALLLGSGGSGGPGGGGAQSLEPGSDLAGPGTAESLDRRLLGPGGGPDPDHPGQSGVAPEGIEGIGPGAVQGAPSEYGFELLDPAGPEPGAGSDPDPWGAGPVPPLPRVVHTNPELPLEIHPDELPSLVRGWARVSGDWTVGQEISEVEVREAYDLPEVPQERLAARSWGDRARDLVRDGWAKLRSLFQRVLEPTQDHQVEDDPFAGLEAAQIVDPLLEAAKRSLEEGRAKQLSLEAPDHKPARPKDPGQGPGTGRSRLNR